MICLCLTGNTLDKNTAFIRQYAPYINLVELRVDLLNNREQQWDAIAAWARTCTFPIIFTIREPVDGGSWNRDLHTKTQLLTHAVQSGLFRWIDIEAQYPTHIDTFYHMAYTTPLPTLPHTQGTTRTVPSSSHNTTIIISKHYVSFEHAMNTQHNWRASICEIAAQYPHAMLKCGIACEKSAHLQSVLQGCKTLNDTIPSRYIVAPMGSYGQPGRILTVHTGSAWTYTSPADGTSAAPGHISPDILHTRYRYHNIKKTTPVFAVIGNPIMHSRSPEFHNNIFIERGIDAVYIHLHLDDIAILSSLVSQLNIQGLSVTLPHKHAILSLLTTQDETVQASNTCNTVVIRNQAWHGYNTDVTGFLVPLLQHIFPQETITASAIPAHLSLEGMRCTIIGAGGSAHALAYALYKRNASLLIVNRTIEKADALAVSLTNSTAPYTTNVQVTTLDDYSRIATYADLMVQTTSVGMNNVHATPLPDYPFTSKELVYDIIYTPPVTRIMQDAQQAGCATISGERMFLAQAQAQATYFCDQATRHSP